MNHYPRHIGDYIRDTVGLTMMQDGAYTRLLDQYYATGRPIPLDSAAIYRMTRAMTRQEQAAVESVLVIYFERRDDGWHQKRVDRELASYSERSAIASASASARWSKRNANAMPMQCEGNANQNQNQNQNQEPKPVGQEQSVGAVAPSAARRPTRLAEDWQLPQAWGEWAMAERSWPADEVRSVALLFRDHWRGKGEARADWEATWRNWVRRERSYVAPTTAKQTARAKVAGDIWKGSNDERPAERVIDGESERVA